MCDAGRAYILAQQLKILASKGVLSSSWCEKLDSAADELEKAAEMHKKFYTEIKEGFVDGDFDGDGLTQFYL